jgi:predicted metal-binding membrane protein
MNAVATATKMSPGRQASILWPWALVAAAWASAVLAGRANRPYLVDHHLLMNGHLMFMGGHFMRMGGLGLPWYAALAIFLATWQVMTAAMMLPSSMPMLYMIIHASRQGARPRRVQAAFLAGYAAVWTVFAVAAFVLDLAVQALAGSWPWLAERPWLIGSVTLAIAGGFQFSALKERCLTACRSPLGFFVQHYRRGERGAWRLGLRHGAFCLGCCWALMLVMFGVGIHSLMLMAGLAGVMVIEKAVPGGRRLSPLIGGTLLVLAALWLVHPTWLAVASS